MAVDCFKGVKIKGLAETYESRIQKGMTDEQLRDIGTEVVIEHFNKLAKDMNALNKSIGVKGKVEPVAVAPKPVEVKKKEAVKPKPEPVKAKPKETAPEIKQANKQIDEAVSAVTKAKDALARKAKELDKAIVEDQTDLFGERKSKDENALFDERVDLTKRKESTAKERKALEDAQKNLKELKAKKAELEITNEVTDELDFAKQTIKKPEHTPEERKKVLDDWVKKAMAKNSDRKESVKEAKSILKEYFNFEIDGQKYIVYPDLSHRIGTIGASYVMKDAYESFFDIIPTNTKAKKGDQYLDPYHGAVHQVVQANINGVPIKEKTIIWNGRPHKGVPFPARPKGNVAKWNQKKMEYLPPHFAPGAQRPSPNKEETWLDTFERKLDELDRQLTVFGKETLGMNIPIAMARIAVSAMQTAIQVGRTTGEVLDAGWQALKGTKWYQNLSGKQKHELEIEGLNEALTRAFQKHNAITPEQSANMVDETYDESNEALKHKAPGKKRKAAIAKVITKVSDRQYVSKSLVGKISQVTKDLMINAHGASGKAARVFKEAYDNIFFGLNKTDRAMLDKFIFLARIITIDNNRKDKNKTQVMHPKGLDADTATKALEIYKERLGPEKYNDILRRSKLFFNVYGQLLDARHENGLINDAVYESLSGLNYAPRLFLSHILDFDGNVNMGKAANNKVDAYGLSEEQIKSLDEGSMDNLIMNSEWLLSTSIASATKAMSMNNINKAFMDREYPKAKARAEKLRKTVAKPGQKLSKEDARFLEYFKDLESKIIENPIIGFTKPAKPVAPEIDVLMIGQEAQGIRKPIYKYKTSPKPNFSRAYYYKDGVKNEFFIENKLHESWFDNADGFLSEDWREVISYASGSALLKGFATGNNPAFIIVNTPRDFLFTATFSDQYSSLLPKALWDTAMDARKAGKEIIKFRKGERGDNLLSKAIEYGLDMSFLSTQGRLKNDTMLAETIDKLIDPRVKDKLGDAFDKGVLHGLSYSSEIVFRLALMKRTMKNELKKTKYESIQDIENDNTLKPAQKKELINDIYNRAVSEARSILDFSQGGTLSKDAESFLPYINTAIQGTRVALTAFHKNPAVTTFKVVQASLMGSLASLGLSLSLLTAARYFDDDDEDQRSILQRWFDGQRGISKYQRMMYQNISTGRKNADGEDNLMKVAKSHQLTPMMSFTDDLLYNWVATQLGEETLSWKQIVTNVWDSFDSNISPIALYNPGKGSVIDNLTAAQQQNATRTPALKAMLSWSTGRDFYRDMPLAREVDQGPRALEGQTMRNVEDFYKKMGRDHGVSAVRVKAAVESYITTPSTNPYIGLTYGFAEYVISEDKSVRKGFLDAYNTSKKSVVGRLSTYTSEFNRNLNANKKYEKEYYKLEVEEGFQKLDRNSLAKQYINGKIDEKKFNDKFSELDPKEQAKTMKKVNDYRRLEFVVDRTIIDIKYSGSSKLKAMKIRNLYGNIFDGSPENTEILREMKIAQGILTDDVLYEYKKLMSQVKK